MRRPPVPRRFPALFLYGSSVALLTSPFAHHNLAFWIIEIVFLAIASWDIASW